MTGSGVRGSLDSISSADSDTPLLHVPSHGSGKGVQKVI